MRKIYLTLMLAMTFAFAGAQSLATGPTIDLSDAQAISMKKALANRAETKTINSRWYDYASTMDAAMGKVSKLARTYLFPDTLINANYGGTYDSPWVHAISIVIDPKSAWFEEAAKQAITSTTAYTVDSVEMWCSYTRATAAGIIDTLRFEVTTTADTDGMGGYYFTSMTNYNTDTLFFKAFKRTSLILDGTTKTTIDFLLHETDTVPNAAGGWNVFGIAANAAVAANDLLGVTVKFIPGYVYTATDTLNSKNYISFYSMEEMGDNTYPNYTKRDWNSSQIVSSSSTKTTSSWFGLYVPEWAYTQSYSFENHLITYKITADAGFTGVENTTNNGLSVSQNRPNPFTGMTTVNYSLTKATNVNVIIYNVAGAKVMTINKGVQAAGSHKVEINASDLQAGVYYYTLTADGYTVTKKMIVY